MIVVSVRGCGSGESVTGYSSQVCGPEVLAIAGGVVIDVLCEWLNAV
jgi:hypothetical protein